MKLKNILAIDPGNKQSGYVIWNGKEVLAKGVMENYDLCQYILAVKLDEFDVMAIEQIESRGCVIGESVIRTAEWSGVFKGLFLDYGIVFMRNKSIIRQHHCGRPNAKDSEVLKALKGKYSKDVLAGVKSHAWQALGVATYCTEMGSLS